LSFASRNFVSGSDDSIFSKRREGIELMAIDDNFQSSNDISFVSWFFLDQLDIWINGVMIKHIADVIIRLVIYVIENDTDTFRERGDAELLTLISVLEELGLIRLNSLEGSVVVDSNTQFFSALWDRIVLFSFSLIGF